MERKRKRENINDLYTKHNSNELKYKNKRIFRNKLKYLEKEKTNLYNILPNVKSTTKQLTKEQERKELLRLLLQRKPK
jgi:RNA polymerase-interacting CarD/CdnL/TRCF family regulator